MFLFLPEREMVDALAFVASSPASSTGTDRIRETTALLFAIYSYAGQLSPLSSDTLPMSSTHINTPNLGGITNKITADL